MGHRKSTPHSYMIEQYKDHEIRVTPSGKFQAMEGGDVAFEAETLERVKNLIDGPRQKLDIKCMLFDDWESFDQEAKMPTLVTVYAITPAGNVLYSRTNAQGHTYQGKLSPYSEKLYVHDDDKLAKRREIHAQIVKLHQEFSDLMMGWEQIRSARSAR